jgi:Zn-finger nucleic acid-binding protein
MRCPHDETVLQMTERSGVEIDYCPTCRGVWLDRGELDKIIEKAAVSSAAPPPPGPGPDSRTQNAGYPRPTYAAPPGTAYPPPPGSYPRYADSPDSPDERRYGHDQGYGDPRYRNRGKRDSFLGNLFDF